MLILLPSRQIRPPIYSLKQSKLRKRRVIRFAILYFVMFVVFLLLVIGPVIASKQLEVATILPAINVMNGPLLQPNGLNNNDTRGFEQTGPNGAGAVGGGGGGPAATGGLDTGGDSIDTGGDSIAPNAVRMFMRY